MPTIGSGYSSSIKALYRSTATAGWPLLDQEALADTLRYEMRREPQEIIPKLWLGPFQASTNLAKMQALGLTHV